MLYFSWLCTLAWALPLFASEGPVNKTFLHRDPRHQIASKNIGNEIYYQIFVDRFFNGNPRNDCIYDERFCSLDQSDWYRYFGGDLRGIIKRVPYLKALGATRLWLTPIFENQYITEERPTSHGKIDVTSFHGYWMRDWYQLNPMFTDHGAKDFGILDELVNTAWPEMRIMLDSATNHSSPISASSWSLELLNRREPLHIEGHPEASHVGAIFRQGKYVTSYNEDMFLRQKRTPRYAPRFHHYPIITDFQDPFQLVYYSLFGLADIAQENDFMDSYLWEAHAYWLRDMFPRLAGFRMDTIKHVSLAYWQRFSKRFFNEFVDKEIVGEYFGAGPGDSGSRAFYVNTQMSMFDFEFRQVIEDLFIHNGNFSKLVQLWANDPNLIDARSLVTFLDNHDLPRLRGSGMDYRTMKQAIALWIVARGVPCIYYGMEQDLFYGGEEQRDPYNRPMMNRFDTRSDMFTYLQKLIQLRKGNEALRYGKTHVVHETQHIIAFERILDDKVVFFVTSKNPITGADSFVIDRLSFADGVYEDVLSPGRKYAVADGKMSVRLQRGDVILIAGN